MVRRRYGYGQWFPVERLREAIMQDNTLEPARDREAVTIKQIQDALRQTLPPGYDYASCSDFCGDAACGIDLMFEQCADEVQVWGDDHWQPKILRAFGEALIAAAEGRGHV